MHLLCAGAAKGVVEALATDFERETGASLGATFGAVGAMKERLDAGTPCDVIVLTAVLIDALAADGRVDAAAVRRLGEVPTGVAVRVGDATPAIGDADALRASFRNAPAIYFPDPERATAGIHFIGVLRRLGIHDEVAARLRPHPNGATAMRALAASGEPGAVGCTQVTEIRYTPGVTEVGALPEGFELRTMYAAAPLCASVEPAAARVLVEWLGGGRSHALRIAGGFEI